MLEAAAEGGANHARRSQRRPHVFSQQLFVIQHRRRDRWSRLLRETLCGARESNTEDRSRQYVPHAQLCIAGYAPIGRVFFGFAVHPIHVSDRRTGGSGNVLVTFGGGFEYEGALRGPNRLPSGFRLVLSGELDLLKAVPHGMFR